MGGPCDTLVPAALLYENPKGLDFNEFYSKTKEIHKKISFGDLTFFLENKYSFARSILNHPIKKEHNELMNSYYDNEFNYFTERFFSLGDLKLIKQQHHLLEEGLKFDITPDFVKRHQKRPHFEDYPYPVGSYLDDMDKAFWVKGVPEKYKKNPEVGIQVTSKIKQGKPRLVDYDRYEVDQTLEGRAVLFDTKEENFESAEELAKKYPKYSLENVFDFSLEKGFLYPSNEKGTSAGLVYKKRRPFVWNKKGKNYTLDENHMLDNLNPNSVYANDSRNHWSSYSHIDFTEEWKHKGNGGTFSFTDLIVTNEAIKKQNWKLLKYTGNRSELLKFLYNNPEVFAAYEKAVLDTEFSLEAKKQGLTNFEFLRDYHNKTASRKQLDLSVARKELEEHVEKEKEEKRKHMERVNKEFRERGEDDLPF